MVDKIQITIAGKTDKECYASLEKYRGIFGIGTNWSETADLEWTDGEIQSTHEPIKYLTVTFDFKLPTE